MWVLHNLTKESIYEGPCTCYKGFENHLCKHMLSLGTRLDYIEVPAGAKTKPIGKKRKIGRPSKSKKLKFFTFSN